MMDGTICTMSGLKFDPFNPDPEQVCLVDIAHALANKCRFTGHTEHHYSVAQHCVYALWMARKRNHSLEIQKWAFLHDANEAYFPDVASPLKPFLFVQTEARASEISGMEKQTLIPFQAAEDALNACIMGKFGLPPEMPAEVRDIDQQLFRRERSLLMPDTPWRDVPEAAKDTPMVVEWEIEYARDAWYYIATVELELSTEGFSLDPLKQRECCSKGCIDTS